MSDLMLDHVRNMLSRVSHEMRELGDRNIESMDTVLGALNDMAANVLALEAVVGAMVKKYPVEVAEAKRWLAEHLSKTGGNAPVANDLIDYILSK